MTLAGGGFRLRPVLIEKEKENERDESKDYRAGRL